MIIFSIVAYHIQMLINWLIRNIFLFVLQHFSDVKFFASFWFISIEAEFAFSIYDADGTGKIDAYDLGDVLRALNCNPTLALIEKMGGTKKRNEKLLSLEEFLPILGQVRKEKEQGCYEDFLECLKLYDKNENGFMLLAELNHALLALGKLRSLWEFWQFAYFDLIKILGENLDNDQVEAVFKDCMGEENDDGEIQYAREYTLFLKEIGFILFCRALR